MPQTRRARDEAGNIWEVDENGNVVRLIQQAGQQNQPPVDPQYQVDRATVEPQIQRSRAQAENEAAQAAVNQATIGAQTRTANAQAAQAEMQVEEAHRDAEQEARRQSLIQQRNAWRADDVLEAINEARAIAMRGGTGAGSLLDQLPATEAYALRTAVDTIKANLAFDRLTQMREESTTGGAVGNVTERELDLLASTVASTDTGVDLDIFLDRLDRIERSFSRIPVEAAGLDPNSDEGRAAMREIGYSGTFPGEEQATNARLTTGEDQTATTDIPEEYQREHLRYLRQNWGNIEPAQYALFRSRLDQAHGLTPDMQAYEAAVPGFNSLAAEGGIPEQLGQVPGPDRPRGGIERTINDAVLNPWGTAALNAANAGGLGLSSALSGNQRQLDMLREINPKSSMAGELVGGISGGGLTGAAYGAATRGGGGALARLLVPEAVYGGTYGATQNTNDPIGGAAAGAAGGIGGALLGRQIGRTFAPTFAPGATRRAVESVPDAETYQQGVNEAYRNVMRDGITATPERTQELSRRLRGVLRQEGEINPQGQYIGDTEGGMGRVMRTINSYDGQEMNPLQAQTYRQNIGRLFDSPQPADQRTAARLTDVFDEVTAETLPGIAEANRMASRGIQARQIDQAIQRGRASGSTQPNLDEGAALRTQFGQLNTRQINNQARFDPDVSAQIARAAEGDAVTNTLRQFGKLGVQGNLLGGLGGGGMAGAIGAGVAGLPGAVAAGGSTMAAGSAARAGSNARTIWEAELARLTALGGDDFIEAMDNVRTRAGDNAGRMVGGLFGSASAINARDQRF